MGVYSVSKHAVVSLSETLYQDLALVTDQVGASVLCPFFVATGISQSHRNRPGDLAPDKPTRSQLIGQAMSDKAVSSGKVTAADVAQMVFDAVAANRFYIYSHPKAIHSVQTRMEDILQARNPTDPFADTPELGVQLKNALRGAYMRCGVGSQTGTPGNYKPAALKAARTRIRQTFMRAFACSLMRWAMRQGHELRTCASTRSFQFFQGV